MTKEAKTYNGGIRWGRAPSSLQEYLKKKKNVSACGATSTEQFLNVGRRPQISKNENLPSEREVGQKI